MASSRSSLVLNFLCFAFLLRPYDGRLVERMAVETTTEAFTLASVRAALVRQEDTIVFCLIERARYLTNSPAYSPFSDGHSGSLLEFFVGGSEFVAAKAGRYTNPEEIPFFPDHLPMSTVPHHSSPQSKFLYPPAASVNVSKTVWKAYTEDMLPLFTSKGDDGNYASAAESDLVCLQALSRRIHYGRFVAEVKFRDTPKDYIPAIRAKDKDTLTKLLTDKSVEEEVQKRVEKKASIFGQDVSLDDNSEKGNNTASIKTYKVDPSVASRIYSDWVIPLTKEVEVEYLLRRLNGSYSRIKVHLLKSAASCDRFYQNQQIMNFALR